jgi:hypothetical protein
MPLDPFFWTVIHGDSFLSLRFDPDHWLTHCGDSASVFQLVTDPKTSSG